MIANQTFGQRLREERKRLGLSQAQCAELCGIIEKTQGLYESSVRRPDTDYLEAFAKAGADVSYLITGKACSTALTEEERSLLGLFRQMDTGFREIFLGDADAAVKTLQGSAPAAGRSLRTARPGAGHADRTTI
ncbi:MAG: helix-turn-helix domain-containing protein [Desulfovibrio sp.]|jgi:transcriptional regulator with XRE-family HTH domain|nr:helix-turn-helix domain-containing protein [Desulfovibrio sp.]